MVEKKIEEFKDYKTINGNMQCFKFSCPDYISCYRRSKEVVNKIGEVKNLTQSGNFSTVAHPKPPPEELQFLSSANYASFESRELVFNSIMEAAEDSNVKIIGVYGNGGVGKTTMVEEVGKQVKKDGFFDEVVVAVISQDVNVSKIQGQLADCLSLKLDAETEVGKANQLWNRLNNGKKNLIILDDIWQKLDLKTIGIPITNENKCCKVVITSRIRSVLENMQVDRFFSIQVLSEKEAWALFKKKVGDSVDSPQLHDIADAVCKECGGLPVAILAVGAALTYKEDMYAWEDALYQLKNSMLKNIEGIDGKLYSSLKFSYDCLKSKDAKLCFLLCCLFPEDDEISIDELVRQCIARRLLDHNMGTLEKARNRVLTVVKTLKTSCLLIEGNDENIVKMHDVIRDVAISIAKDDEAFLVKHGVQEWPEKDTYESSSAISLRSTFIHEVPNELGCPQLHTLLLDYSRNTLVIIPNMFFSGMEKLTVLYLGKIHMLQLPSSLANLVNLRMLCLNECKLEDIAILKDLKKTLEILSLRGSDIEVLPSEIGELTRLRLLDLGDCNNLTEIPQGVISNLSRLEELYSLDGFQQWEAPTTNKERSNVSLDELSKLARLTTLHIHIPNVKLWPKDLCFENLIRFNISIGDENKYEYENYSRMFRFTSISLMAEFNVLLERAESLQLRKIKGFQEVHHDRGGEGFLMQHHGLNTSRSFNKLTVLSIDDCRLKYLFSPSCARGILQLQRLKIQNCEIMEEVVGIEEEKDEEDLTSQVINFSQLKYMRLQNLPNLIGFYLKMEKTTSKENSSTKAQSLFNEKVTFPALEELYIHNLRMITEIWDRKLLQSESFCQLRNVKISGCDNLVNVVWSNLLQRREIVEDNDNIISFPQLRSLNLKHLQSLKSFCTSRFETQSLFNSQVSCPVLKFLTIQKVPNITEIWDKQLLPFPGKETNCQLEYMTIKDCEKMVNVVWSNMFSQLQNLKQLTIQSCKKVEVIVAKGKEDTNDDIIVFSQLTTLTLQNLVNLKSFYNWSIISEAQPLFNHQVVFPVLEELLISRVPNITEIWDNEQVEVMKVNCFDKLMNFVQSNKLPRLRNLGKHSDKAEEKATAPKKKRNDVIIVFRQLRTLRLDNLQNLKFLCRIRGFEAHALFNHQITFPELKVLSIGWVPNITDIWDKRLHPAESFCQLRDVRIEGCDKLVNVILSNMLPRLQNLEELSVQYCPMVEEILSGKGEEKEEATDNIILLPQLRSLELGSLENLKSFCSSRIEAHHFFSHQITFAALEELHICNLPNITKIWGKQFLPVPKTETESFRQLKVVKVTWCEKLVNVIPSSVLPRLQNLKSIYVKGCPKMESIVSKKAKANEANNDYIIVFPELSSLSIDKLDNLRSFCNSFKSSEAQHLFSHQVAFPALEDLFINRVPTIIEIWDKKYGKLHPKRSFCQLRRMMIEQCGKLVNVVGSDMLPQLKNLEELSVYSCPKLEVIVWEKEGKEIEVTDNAILFPQLSNLNLICLENLKTFHTSRYEAQPFLNHQVALPKLEKLSLDRYLEQRLLKGKECARMNETDDKDTKKGKNIAPTFDCVIGNGKQQTVNYGQPQVAGECSTSDYLVHPKSF